MSATPKKTKHPIHGAHAATIAVCMAVPKEISALDDKQNEFSAYQKSRERSFVGTYGGHVGLSTATTMNRQQQGWGGVSHRSIGLHPQKPRRFASLRATSDTQSWCTVYSTTVRARYNGTLPHSLGVQHNGAGVTMAIRPRTEKKHDWGCIFHHPRASLLCLSPRLLRHAVLVHTKTARARWWHSSARARKEKTARLLSVHLTIQRPSCFASHRATSHM